MNLILFLVLRGAHQLDKGRWTFLHNVGLVEVVKVQNYTFSGIFVNMEISKLGENVRNCFSGEIVYLVVIPKENPNNILMSLLCLDRGLIGLGWVEAKAAAVVELVHHHFVHVRLWKVVR